MIVPREIRKKSAGAGIKILWSDNHESEYSAHFLRDNCRCAACRHELTGERLLKDVPADIRVERVELMGQYALGLGFSDGHSTGIYTFDWLRPACPCCTARAE